MKKFFRSLARDNRGAAIGSGICGVLGALIGSTVSPELGIAMAGASSAVGVGIGKIGQHISEEESWTWASNYDLSKNSCIIGKQKVVGKRSDLKKIIRAQKAIDRITKKYETLDVLPDHAQRDVLAHVQDLQPVIERCKVYLHRYYSDTQQKQTMDFSREFYNSRGAKDTQVLVSVELSTRPEALEKFKPAVLPSLETQKLQAEFDAAAKLEQQKKQDRAGRKFKL